ncbi:hypothetical protein ACQI4L_25365 [Mycolicibacterium litorale]|uniref:hypothetical protein n=1 Tax=Mycolicibacterium litorale TaxID=758802 RepID=UPI003CEF19B1
MTGRRREGAAILVADFEEVLTRLAQECGDARVSAAISRVVARLGAPLRVTVSGRAGVGRTTLTRVLAGAGLRIVEQTDGADVAVVVVAEVVKPEDRSSVARGRDAGVPVLVVCKADLTGPVPQEALRRAAGAPVVAAVALLADLRLDDQARDALRTLAAQPAGGAPPLPHDDQARLVRLLGRYGIAHGVAALRDGVDVDRLPGLLRGLGNLDAVLGQLDALTAPARYRRVRAALTGLQALATGSDAVADFLAGDDAVLAAMTAAVDVVQAAGLRVDPRDDPAAHLRRAVRWRAYSRGPVSPLHRACGADISRGSLRLFERHR